MENTTTRPYKGSEAAIKNMGISRTRYDQYLERFRSNYGNSPDEIHALLECGSTDHAAAAAHSVKGLSSTLGLHCLSSAAADLEVALKSGGSWEHELEVYRKCIEDILNE